MKLEQKSYSERFWVFWGGGGGAVITAWYLVKLVLALRARSRFSTVWFSEVYSQTYLFMYFVFPIRTYQFEKKPKYAHGDSKDFY